MSMMTSQILEFQDSRKAQKPKYLEIETLLFLQIVCFLIVSLYIRTNYVGK